MSSSDQTDSVPVGITVFAVVLLIVIGAAGYMVYQKKRGEDGQLWQLVLAYTTAHKTQDLRFLAGEQMNEQGF